MTTGFHPAEAFTSWGRVVLEPHTVARPRFPDELGQIAGELTNEAPGLPVGLRHSYGDSNLNLGGRIIDMTGLDRLIAFDKETGPHAGGAR